MLTSHRNTKNRYTRLTDSQAEKIHAASLLIIEKLGVQIHLPEAVDLLKSAGSTVSEDGLVHIPPKLVEWAFSTAPKLVTLYNRNGDPVMPLQNDNCFFGPGSDCLNILDHKSGERRAPILQDVRDGIRLCDALEHIDFVMSMVLPMDVDKTIADTYQVEAIFNHTIKPVITVSYETQGLIDAVAMAEVVVGGEQILQEKPILACYINPPSGRVHGSDNLKKLLFLAEKDLPSIYIPASNACVTSPASFAGALAVDNAGLLVGLVLSQLKREGAPYIVSGMDSATLDMKTMVSPYGYPERGITRSLVQRYQLPAFALSGSTDSKVIDQQAAAEAALSLMADVLMGGNIIHDLGYLESGLTYSFTQLAICNEMVNWIKTFYNQIEVSEETLALDVVERVGAEGQYLKDKHTRKHYQDHWYPNLFERGNHRDWMQKGGKTLAERAAEQVTLILENHVPEHLPEDIKEQLSLITQKAEKR